MLRAFPVHFGLIDAFVSADGAFGFRGDKTARCTKTILASRDLVALDWVGASKMGMDPMDSVLMRKVVAEWGRPTFELEGDASVYEGWTNPPLLLDKLDDALEEFYCMHNFFTHLTMFRPDPIFEEKDKGIFETTRKVLGLDWPL